MTPRRLLPYLLLFLALAGSYAALKWHQDRKEARERQAQRIFQVKEGEIREVALIKGPKETRLVKGEQGWQLIKPIKARADQEVVAGILGTLAHLQKVRDLGGDLDPKSFGMAQPFLRVEFTAQGQPHRLTIGSAAPGENSYYALKDREPNLLLIDAGAQNSLDRTLTALRDKILWAFSQDKVEAVRIKRRGITVPLARSGPGTWRWEGRQDLPVRSERVEALLRSFTFSRVREFVAEAPKDLRPYGLAPQPQTEIVVVSDQGEESLVLGAKTDKGIYARKGGAGPVVLVDQDLGDQVARTLASLEDRRLVADPLTEVHKVVWGSPGQHWVAVKDKDFWQLSGPSGQPVRQLAIRLEAALWILSQLEYDRLLPPAAALQSPESFLLELYDRDGNLQFRLGELKKQGEVQVAVRTQKGDKTAMVLLPRKNFSVWQEEMARLTAAPEKKE